ncbi:MAG: hypothetical protein KDB35_08215 [Acidimicrobiales bacterium]|nr:hypothetical protein [Acidimicrobiales bacterium]
MCVAVAVGAVDRAVAVLVGTAGAGLRPRPDLALAGAPHRDGADERAALGAGAAEADVAGVCGTAEAAARLAGRAIAAFVDAAVAVFVRAAVARLDARDDLAGAGAPGRAPVGREAELDARAARADARGACRARVTRALFVLEALAALVELAVAVVVDAVTALLARLAFADADVPGAELLAGGAVLGAPRAGAHAGHHRVAAVAALALAGLADAALVDVAIHVAVEAVAAEVALAAVGHRTRVVGGKTPVVVAPAGLALGRAITAAEDDREEEGA